VQRNSATDRTECKLKPAIMKKELRKIERQHGDQYIVDLEYSVHGHQDKAYKIK
jgi:hypothetical protein